MHLDPRIDDNPDPRPAMGLIVLASDETVEPDFRRLVPVEAARLLHSRIPSAPTIGTGTLTEMGARLPDAAGLLPVSIDFKVIGYACTSGATVLGEDHVRDAVKSKHPGAAVTNPLTALKAACAGLGVKRLGLLSPYVADVSAALIDALEKSGIEIARLISFDEENENLVARISNASIMDGMRAAAAGGCDAVFASCTNLRAMDVLVDAERALDLPVLASNQVLAWHMLRLAGVSGPLAGLGRLGAC